MIIKIGNRWYNRKRHNCNTALITLLRYRAEFGESFLKMFFSKEPQNYELSLVRLVWASIEGKKPDFKNFLTAASKCKNFGAAALSIQAAVMMSDKIEAPQNESSDSDIDEFDILALMAATGISMDLVHVLPAFLITSVVSKKINISHGSKPSEKQSMKFRKMSDTEVREAYRR